MPECTKDERYVLDALHRHGAFEASPGPYPKSPRKAGLVRWRLFTQRERRTILHSLPDSAGGLLDELEMINFCSSTLWPERIER